MPFVIIYNPTLRIVGPFENPAAAGNWGAQWQKEHGDNPCWNTIDLDSDSIDADGVVRIAVEVEHP